MVVVDQEVVVEVAAHFLGGIHDGVEVKFRPVREGGEMGGEHVGLDLGRDGEFCVQALFFRGDIDDLVDISIHFFGHV